MLLLFFYGSTIRVSYCNCIVQGSLGFLPEQQVYDRLDDGVVPQLRGEIVSGLTVRLEHVPVVLFVNDSVVVVIQ